MKNVLSLVVGSDSNVWKVLTYRLWTIFAGVITVIFVPRYLSSHSQGYYYTFLSIVALQVLFDLGLSQTVTQVSSHEFAHVDLTQSSGTRNDIRLAKLAYIKAAIAQWYRWVGLSFVLIVALVGAAYFLLFGAAIREAWLGPWVALVVATGINLVLSPRLAMAEGAGWTGTVATVRLAQSIIGYALLVMCLVGGAGLWSVVAVPLAASIGSFLWLRVSVNPYRSIPAHSPSAHDHSPWRSELLGLQWRVAVAWLGGYFASQIIVPVVFALRGPVEAGKIGLGLQIFSAIQALGMSWISARAPQFAQFISRSDWAALNRRFTQATINATAVSALMAAGVMAALVLARHRGLFLADRIPSTVTIATLALVATLSTVIYALAAYMRAHKEEPLVLSSLVIGGMTFVGASVGARLGTDQVVLAYAAVTLFINLPWTIWIFRGYYHRHAASGSRDEQN